MNAMTYLTTKDVYTNSSLEIFNDQPIPSDYYDILKDDDENGNNIPVTPVYNALPENEGGEDEVVPNDEDINDKIIFDDYDSLASAIDPSDTKLWKFKECTKKKKR